FKFSLSLIMIFYKIEILNNICYTELVFKRINKKLNISLGKSDIKKLLYDIIKDTHESFFQKTGKNIYISNQKYNITITINSNTYRVITTDLINTQMTFTPTS